MKHITFFVLPWKIPWVLNFDIENIHAHIRFHSSCGTDLGRSIAVVTVVTFRSNSTCLCLVLLEPWTDRSWSIAFWSTRRWDCMTGLVQTSSAVTGSRFPSPPIVSRECALPFSTHVTISISISDFPFPSHFFTFNWPSVSLWNILIWLDSFPLLSQRTRTRHYFPDKI